MAEPKVLQWQVVKGLFHCELACCHSRNPQRDVLGNAITKILYRSCVVGSGWIGERDKEARVEGQLKHRISCFP